MKKVAEHCLRFSPQICIREPHAVFVEIGKCRKLYSEAGFHLRILVVLRRLGLTAEIGIGHDIPEALLMAKYKTQNPYELSLTALMDLADPFNQDLIVQKHVQKLIDSFLHLGVETLGKFRELPLAELTTRFGAIGILCRQRARGEMTVPWPHWKPSEIISEKDEFPYFEFYGELEPILFALKKQLERIFQRLFARGLKAQRLNIKLKIETNSFHPNPIRSFDFEFLFPQGSTKGALNVIRERLARDFARHPIHSPIEGLETTVTEAIAGHIGQRDLLHNKEETAEQLHSLLNQLGENLGKENLFYAELTEDRRPEKSWRKSYPSAFKPAHQSGQPSYSQLNQKTGPESRIPIRPTYLIKPEKVEVTEGFVHIRKRLHRIITWYTAVEKISGGWIENTEGELIPAFDRNYYQVELENGFTITLFETQGRHKEKSFFLHGYFA